MSRQAVTPEPESEPADAGSAVNFEPIAQLRAHEYVAEQLRRHIGLGLVAPGDAFPPERDLARMFGVGRATIQHALRLLEADRLVESRRGRAGGTFVIGPPRDEQGIARLLLDLRLNKPKIEEALIFRRVVEQAAVQLAAENAEPEELEAIEASTVEMRNAPTELEFHRHDTDFHLQIARASHNSLLAEGVERSRLLLNDAILAQPESDMWHERIHREHENILASLQARDAKRAMRAVRTHLEHSEQGIRAVIAALR
ncbi:MAG: GntR family transcriptional regulator, transcriptional repressor for pyruvate dehydrogenase complex [Baekduia sp.]|nr:GntR family transcriptional regulator, transcriptional repressor for pyruvate dehydrogenase complex [Baekduia sp.]